jgi:hypothetical protein
VFRDGDDGQVDIPIDAMLPPLTATSVRSAGRGTFTGDTGSRSDITIDLEVAEKEMRTGQNLISPILEERIKMRLEYLKLLDEDKVGFGQMDRTI